MNKPRSPERNNSASMKIRRTPKQRIIISLTIAVLLVILSEQCGDRNTIWTTSTSQTSGETVMPYGKVAEVNNVFFDTLLFSYNGNTTEYLLGKSEGTSTERYSPQLYNKKPILNPDFISCFIFLQRNTESDVSNKYFTVLAEIKRALRDENPGMQFENPVARKAMLLKKVMEKHYGDEWLYANDGKNFFDELSLDILIQLLEAIKKGDKFIIGDQVIELPYGTTDFSIKVFGTQKGNIPGLERFRDEQYNRHPYFTHHFFNLTKEYIQKPEASYRHLIVNYLMLEMTHNEKFIAHRDVHGDMASMDAYSIILDDYFSNTPGRGIASIIFEYVTPGVDGSKVTHIQNIQQLLKEYHTLQIVEENGAQKFEFRTDNVIVPTNLQFSSIIYPSLIPKSSLSEAYDSKADQLDVYLPTPTNRELYFPYMSDLHAFLSSHGYPVTNLLPVSIQPQIAEAKLIFENSSPSKIKEVDTVFSQLLDQLRSQSAFDDNAFSKDFMKNLLLFVVATTLSGSDTHTGVNSLQDKLNKAIESLQLNPEFRATEFARIQAQASLQSGLPLSKRQREALIGPTDFITESIAGAQMIYEKSGVLPSITLAQKILETGHGNSKLYKKYNNPYGVKWHKKSMKKKYEYTKHYDDCYEKGKRVKCDFVFFPSKREADNYRAQMFTTGRYKFVTYTTVHEDAKDKVDKDNYHRRTIATSNRANIRIRQLAGIKALGYATDSIYPLKLLDIIISYELYKYDPNSRAFDEDIIRTILES